MTAQTCVYNCTFFLELHICVELQMGGRKSVTKEDERVERDGCRVIKNKGAEIRGLGKLER
jgi:hypothetical protein